MGESSPQSRLYLGIDVGGTKIQVTLVNEPGKILGSERVTTPRGLHGPQTVQAIIEAIETTLGGFEVDQKAIVGMGIAIPGVVDPDTGMVVITPNMNLDGTAVGPKLTEHFGIPVVLGNDCNVGGLGETWLGSARGARSAVVAMVGTGIGAGIVIDGQVWRGARGAGGEIGHMIMQPGGHVCGCGNLGCFETLASRTAMEREIRAAMAKGEKTVLTKLLEDESKLIKSGTINRALEAEDPLVCRVVDEACEILGYGCLTINHLFDPEIIVFGGGVVEACDWFMMPIIEKIVIDDPLAGTSPPHAPMVAALGDDAVVYGAVALARTLVGRNPFDSSNHVVPDYPEVGAKEFGRAIINGIDYSDDMIIRADGQVLHRKKNAARKRFGSSHIIGSKELSRACRGGPEIVFIGAGHQSKIELHAEGQAFLRRRRIEIHMGPTPEVAEAYNESDRRRALLMHATC